MCTEFGVDDRFPFRARTNRQTDKQTDATERPTPAGGYVGVANYELPYSMCHVSDRRVLCLFY